MMKTKSLLTIFLCCIATLILIGLIFIYSSSSVYALEKFGYGHYYVKQQLVGLALGLIALIAFMLLPTKLIKKTAPLFYCTALLLTALTLAPGIGITLNGSSRWLSLFGLRFQPSELLKIAVLVYLSAFIEKKQYNQQSFFQSYFPFLVIIALPSLLLLKQPDFGQTVTLAATACIVFFIAGGHVRYIFYTAIPALLGAGLLIYLKSYRLRRILIFLNPWSDPQGDGFQIIQSLIAIGSGKLFGLGITHSKQKFFYLPMQHTDFIFSIIAEETGFIGASFLIVLYIIILFVGLKLALALKTTFSQLVTLGFIVLISLQALINLYVTTGLAPTKGIGLPFVSYGSSALICNLLMLGIVINCIQEDSLS